MWSEFRCLRILVTIISAFLCALCVSNDPVETGEWVVNNMVCLVKRIVHSLALANVQIFTAGDKVTVLKLLKKAVEPGKGFVKVQVMSKTT